MRLVLYELDLVLRVPLEVLGVLMMLRAWTLAWLQLPVVAAELAEMPSLLVAPWAVLSLLSKPLAARLRKNPYPKNLALSLVMSSCLSQPVHPAQPKGHRVADQQGSELQLVSPEAWLLALAMIPSADLRHLV